jgi:hypothetical protein
MNAHKLSSLLALTLSFQLVIAPMNHALALTHQEVNSGLQAVQQIYQTAMQQAGAGGGGMMSMEMQRDMMALNNQQAVQPDKYFNPQKMMQIPGLANYLALNKINPQMLDCKTLPTTIYEASPEVCRIGMTSDRGIMPQIQMQQMADYQAKYFEISKLYRNFTANSNTEGQGFGVGCMNNAMNILNGFFRYRTDEIDKLTTNLEAMQNQFREASRADLDAIEEAVAVLDGNSEIADKVKTKRPDLFDFAKRFENPACVSMMNADAFNQTGREEGLNGIAASLRKTLSTKEGKYSGESYANAHASVVSDIERVAEAASKQMELSFGNFSGDDGAKQYGDFIKSLPGATSSQNGINRSLTPDVFVDLQNKFNENLIKLSDRKNTVRSELAANGLSAESATRLLGNTNTSNFEAEVVAIENKIKNKCLQDTIGRFQKDRLLDRIYDPTASKHANKFSSNFLKDKLNTILNDQNSSLEKKLADLRQVESQSGSRYLMRMENSYEVQEVDENGKLLPPQVVGASSQRTPSAFFSDLIRSCNAQFRANKLDNKISGAGAIQTLRQLNKEFKDLAKAQSLAMRKEIRKRLVECQSPEEANNTLPGSCTPTRFNPSAAGFCANAALSCSKNMQACNQQAANYAREIKEQKNVRVQNYKALMQKNKFDMMKIFDTALSGYMREGEALRGLFGAGFSSPTGIKRELPEGQRYLSEFQDATSRSPDGKLLLEDPDKYLELVKNNLTALKASVQKQQEEILGGQGSGLLARHIADTKSNYERVVSDAKTLGEACGTRYQEVVRSNEENLRRQREEFTKNMTQLGEKRQKFCSLYGVARVNPNAGCSGSIQDVVAGAYAAARIPGGSQDTKAIEDYVQYCAEYGSEGSRVAIVCSKARATDANPRIFELCKQRDEARSCNRSAPQTNPPTSNPACPPQESIKNIEGDILTLSRDTPTGSGTSIQLEDQPAYCAAGNNDSRGMPGRGFLDNFSQGMQRAMGVGQQ